MKAFILGLGLLVSIPLCRADDGFGQLQDYLKKELSTLSSAVQSCTKNTDPNDVPSNNQEDWFFRRFFIKLKPQIALDIPAFTILKLTPEVELVFERTLPQGWQGYKP